jgi:hypothetical protein
VFGRVFGEFEIKNSEIRIFIEKNKKICYSKKKFEVIYDSKKRISKTFAILEG